MENHFTAWRLTRWDHKKHRFVIPHMSAYGMTRVVADRLAAYEELGFTPHQLEEMIEAATTPRVRYRVKDEFIDGWFGGCSDEEIASAQHEGFSYKDIADLSCDWSVSIPDLMEQVEVI